MGDLSSKLNTYIKLFLHDCLKTFKPGKYNYKATVSYLGYIIVLQCSP